MRAHRMMAIALGTAALASAASAQQITTPTSPPTSQAVSGGAEYAAQSTANFDWSRTAAPRPVYAVVGHHLVSGKVEPRAPLLALVDARDPQFVCRLSHRDSDIGLACSDGSLAQVRMSALGCGASRTGDAASLCVGVGEANAARRLVAPPGYAIVRHDGALALKPLGE